MKRRHSFFLASLGLLGMLRATPLVAEEFYATRLRTGADLLRAGKPIDAIDELRIANFGFLNQPVLLEEGLCRLTLAYQAAARPAEVASTLLRIVDVERRFGGSFAKAALEPDTRRQILDLLNQRVPVETLATVPAFAPVVETEEQKLGKLSPKERTKALEKRAGEEPTKTSWPLALARDAAARSDHRAAERWASRALELEPANAEAAALRGHARAARKEWALAIADLSVLSEARLKSDPTLLADLFVAHAGLKDWDTAAAFYARLGEELRALPAVSAAAKRMPKPTPGASGPAPAATSAPAAPAPSGTAGPEPPPPPPPQPAAADSKATVPETLSASRKLIAERNTTEAQRLLVQAIQKTPGSRDLRKALLEAAVLNRDYPTAAAQVRFVDPLTEGEEPWMFYAAVASYEAGNLDAAKALMRRARGKVSGSPFVDYYSRRILGSS